MCFCVACVCVRGRCCCDCAPRRAVCCVLCAVCAVCAVCGCGGDDIFSHDDENATLGCAVVVVVVVVVVIIPSYIVIFLQAPGNQSSLRLGSNIRGSSEKNSILPKKETSQGFEAEVVKELPECVTNTQHSRLYTEG